MSYASRIFLYYLISVLAASLCLAQSGEPPFDFYARGPYRESVPRPQSLLKYDVGEFHTNYAMMERVLERIAQTASDRTLITDIGETNEHRAMRLVVISSPDNLKKLDRIKSNIARLADPRLTSPDEARRIAEDSPVIVWLSHSIHGNESAAFEAMMQVVYQLTASNEPATLDILNNCVVLINACANPDGHERFVTWYNSVSIGNPDPMASEHHEPWSIYGRLNHYRFDLNRDNIVSSQVETRNMQRAFSEWRPQVLVDHHGQQSQSFFPPSALPINPNYPEQTGRWLNLFGRANAEQFDARRWDYFVRDVFDLFYPGYWDSWGSLCGATAMTFETDGGGWKGLNWRREDDTIVTLRSAIAKHYVTSLTVLATAAHHRVARLKDFYEFKRSAIEEGKTEKLRRVVLVPKDDRGQVTELAEILLRAGIEVKVAGKVFSSQKAHDYLEASPPAPREFPAGSYVIDMTQPQKRLAKALLEPGAELDPVFTREQIARFKRNQKRGANSPKEDYGFYDITAWPLPLAFGVEAYWTEDATELIAAAELRKTGASILREGGAGGRAEVAYIIPYQSDKAASLIYRLLKQNYKLAVATRTLNAGGKSWPRGTVVARVSRNPESLHEQISRLAVETGIQVAAVNTGFAEEGDVVIGSTAVTALKPPRIIVVTDEPVYQSSYGSIWWLFDQYGVDFTPMTVSALKDANLERYDVVVLPDGRPGGYSSAFGKDGVDLLRGWCERGGTLVCIKGAAAFAALKDVNLTSSRLVGSKDDDQKPRAEAARATAAASASETNIDPQRQAKAGDVAKDDRPSKALKEIQSQAPDKVAESSNPEPPLTSPSARLGEAPEYVPGAIFRATIDRMSPLTYGYDKSSFAVILNSDYFFRLSREGTNPVVFVRNAQRPLRIAGFTWPGNTEELLGDTAYLIEESVGGGRVILYAEEPTFRGFWRSTVRLFFNSILFRARGA
jgi:hypothetical protein